MELFNRSESLRRQERILRQAQPLVEAALAQAGALPELAEQIYLLGATVVPILRAGYHLVSGGLGSAKADQWLAENLNVLAGMISEETARTVKISVSSTPTS
jgi:hypothetical protein